MSTWNSKSKNKNKFLVVNVQHTNYKNVCSFALIKCTALTKTLKTSY